MTTPEQIIAKIEEIEKLTTEKPAKLFKDVFEANEFLQVVLILKQTAIRLFNLPTADPPEGSPGQEDIG